MHRDRCQTTPESACVVTVSPEESHMCYVPDPLRPLPEPEIDNDFCVIYQRLEGLGMRTGTPDSDDLPTFRRPLGPI